MTSTPKLIKLADACNGGACNTFALINSLAEAVREELKPGEVRDNPAVKIIIGQISYLIGESLGPSGDAMVAYEDYKTTQEVPS